MDYFLDQLQIVLPVLGVNVIRGRKVASPKASGAGSQTAEQAGSNEEQTQDSPVFMLTKPKRGVSLRAQQIDGEFVVFEGSKVVPVWDGVGGTDQVKRTYAALRAKHEKLVADGTIAVEGGHAVLTRDVPFGSPSGAGAILTGTACDGPTSWTTEDAPRLSFGDWRSRGVSWGS